MTTSLSPLVPRACHRFGYQWQFNQIDLPGRTHAALTLTNVRAESSGSYRVRVSDGGGAIFSQPATLLVCAPPYVLVQPQGGSVSAGGQATLRVTVRELLRSATNGYSTGNHSSAPLAVR